MASASSTVSPLNTALKETEALNTVLKGTEALLSRLRAPASLKTPLPEEVYTELTNSWDVNRLTELSKSHDLTTVHDGSTLLHAAANEEKLDFIQKLLKCGVVVDLFDSKQNTVAHIAAMAGKVSVLQYLITLSNKDFIDRGDTEGKTPLHLATIHKQHAAMRSLAEYTKKSPVDNAGRTPLHYAAEANDRIAAKILQFTGSNIKDKDGKCPRDLATSKALKRALWSVDHPNASRFACYCLYFLVLFSVMTVLAVREN